MRDFHLVIPRDCVASVTDEENTAALNQLRLYGIAKGPVRA
jgi:hypothetical protein